MIIDNLALWDTVLVLFFLSPWLDSNSSLIPLRHPPTHPSLHWPLDLNWPGSSALHKIQPRHTLHCVHFGFFGICIGIICCPHCQPNVSFQLCPNLDLPLPCFLIPINLWRDKPEPVAILGSKDNGGQGDSGAKTVDPQKLN